MYSVLVVCSIPGLLKNLQTHLPNFNPDVVVTPASSEEDAMRIMGLGTPIDVVVCEHNKAIDAFRLFDSMCKTSSTHPAFILTTDNPDIDNAVRAFEYRMDYFLFRSVAPASYYMELAQKITFACERDKAEKSRSVDMKRLNAVMTLADIRDHPLKEILNYALETSVELTGSEIGYLATYDASSRKLRIMSWSIKAMGQCRMINRPMEYDLDSSGMWGEPIRLMKAVVINDYDTDGVYKKNGLPMGHVQLRNLLMIPIIRNGVPVATAGVGNKSGTYTEDDEIQLRLLVDSMYSIYQERMMREDVSKNEVIVNELVESSVNGVILIDRDFRIKVCNSIAKRILKIPDSVVLGGKITDMLSSASMRYIYYCVLDAFKLKSTKNTYITEGTEKGSKQYHVVCSLSMDVEMEPEGCLISITDVQSFSNIGATSKVTMDKLRVMSTTINDIVSSFSNKVRANGNVVGDEDWQLLSDISEFANVQRKIGESPPIWKRLETCIPQDVEGLKVRTDLGPINVLCDSAFNYVFESLMTYSRKLGATAVSIGVRMKDGKLTIIYEDDGAGISHSVKMLMFSGRTNMGIWTLLVSDIINACGYKIQEIGTYGEGMRVEIDVPGDSFSLGQL